MATIVIKNSSTPGAVPVAGDLVKGELAVNLADRKMYSKNATNQVITLLDIGETAGYATAAAASATSAASSATAAAASATSAASSATAAASSATTAAASAAIFTPISNFVWFTSSGTWTCPPGVKKAKVYVTGAGGSAGSFVSQAGAGGSGGGTAIKWLTVVPGTVYTVTIGAGGAGVTVTGVNTPGNPGGNSSFSGPGISTIVGPGGLGGQNVTTVSGGSPTTGDINIKGGVGTSSASNQSTPAPLGGGTFFSSPTIVGQTPVHGAGSAANFNAVGSPAGADGVVLVEY